MSSQPDHKTRPWYRLPIEIIVVLFIGLASAGLASQAAFPQTTAKPVTDHNSFWQSDEQSNESSVSTSSVNQEPNQDENTDPSTTQPPEVSAKAYIVANLKNKKVLAQKNASTVLPIASVTKLITAVISDEMIGRNKDITITQSAIDTYGESGKLSANTSMPLKDLYYPLLLSSSNDAAAALAQHGTQDRFLRLMNRKAFALDMRSTRFADASGLSAQNVSTAQDLLRLTKYLYSKKQPILDITTKASRSIPYQQADTPTRFVNNNPTHSLTGFIGGKNGYTDAARYTSLSIFQIQKKDIEKVPVAIIVLGADNDIEDVQALRKWASSL